MDVLVIGDAHAKPGVSQRRFTWLGKYLAAAQPDVVVDIGDWADMPSLSSYDGSKLTGNNSPKRSFEGASYKRDIEASVEASDRVHVELQKAARKRPRRIALGGNHDDERINRALQNVRELEGVISVRDHQREDYGWDHIPFLEAIDVGGFLFSHYFVSGSMGRPTAGEHPAATLLKTQHHSCVAGHSHMFNEAHRTSANGKRIQAFVAGCFLDPTQIEHYAGPANHLWSKGLLLMRDVDGGLARGGFEWIPVGKLMKEFAN